MDKISDLSLLCKRPVISILRNRVVRLSRYKGRKLEHMMDVVASNLKMSVDECHFCLTQFMLRYAQTGELPTDFEKAMLTIPRLWIAGELPQPTYGSFTTPTASGRVYDDPSGSRGYLH